MKIGDPLPAFAPLPGVDGKSCAPEDFRQSPVLVVVFSCNHCPYVKAYERRMVAFQQEYGPRGVQLMAINANDANNYPEDNFAEMVRRSREEGFNFPYLRDESQQAAEAFGATHTPEFFVFDGERRLRYHGKMDDNYQDPHAVREHYLRDAVDAVLAGRTVATPETHSIGCTIKWKY
jgi:peroxiredoxin